MSNRFPRAARDDLFPVGLSTVIVLALLLSRGDPVLSRSAGLAAWNGVCAGDIRGHRGVSARRVLRTDVAVTARGCRHSLQYQRETPARDANIPSIRGHCDGAVWPSVKRKSKSREG